MDDFGPTHVPLEGNVVLREVPLKILHVISLLLMDHFGPTHVPLEGNIVLREVLSRCSKLAGSISQSTFISQKLFTHPLVPRNPSSATPLPAGTSPAPGPPRGTISLLHDHCSTNPAPTSPAATQHQGQRVSRRRAGELHSRDRSLLGPVPAVQFFSSHTTSNYSRSRFSSHTEGAEQFPFFLPTRLLRERG